MIIVPITRLRREIRKWLHKNEVIHISRNGIVVAVLIPANEYEDMYETIQEYKELIEDIK